MGGNTRGYARPFTLEEIQLANKLRHEDRLDWEVVARRLGPDVLVWSIKTVVSLYRRGKWQPKRAVTRVLREKLEVAVTEYGVTDVEALCKHFEVGEESMYYNLRQMGLDLESRKEIRREFDLKALRTMDAVARTQTRRVA
jgi:cobalamin biosynthesis Mg chelatase CobN